MPSTCSGTGRCSLPGSSSLVRNAAILLFPQHICQILQIFPLKIASFSNPWEKYRKEMKNFKCDLNCPQPGNVHFVTLKGSTLRAEISEVEEQRQKFGLCRAELLPFPALLGSGFGATALAARGTKGSGWINGSAPERCCIPELPQSDMCPLCSLTALQLTRERLLNAFPARAQPLPVFTQPCAPWQLPGIHCP